MMQARPANIWCCATVAAQSATPALPLLVPCPRRHGRREEPRGLLSIHRGAAVPTCAPARRPLRSSCARWTRRLRSRRQHRRLAVDPGSGASGPQRRPKRRRDSGSPSDGGRWARAWKALGGCAYLREVADAQSGAGQQGEVLRGGDELGEVRGETDVLADRGREPARTVEPQRRPQQRRADCLVSMQGDAQAPQAQSCRPTSVL